MTRMIQELHERQAWTLDQKIDHSLGVIDQFISHCGGKDKVYISFSGGKDSTVLLHLARRVFGADLKAVFCNTGNEFPDIVKFVRSTPNVNIIYPKYKPREVLEKYGFPVVSKEASHNIHQLKYTQSENLRNTRLYGKPRTDGKGVVGKISDKWQFLAKKQYDCSELCCHYLKKEPFYRYEKETNTNGILGVMAEESKMRTSAWLNYSCNEFDNKRILSKPLSIWTDKDIWEYIKKYNVPISEIYHKGAKRTGCMFCGFGVQFPNDNRLEMLNTLYPKFYAMAMNYTNNGITYREALRDVLKVNGLYLPDEQPKNLFTYQQ